jgi:hypothetical protein
VAQKKKTIRRSRPKVLKRLIDEFVESLRPDQLRVIATKLHPDQKQLLLSLLSADQQSVVDEGEN